MCIEMQLLGILLRACAELMMKTFFRNTFFFNALVAFIMKTATAGNGKMLPVSGSLPGVMSSYQTQLR